MLLPNIKSNIAFLSHIYSLSHKNPDLTSLRQWTIISKAARITQNAKFYWFCSAILIIYICLSNKPTFSKVHIQRNPNNYVCFSLTCTLDSFCTSLLSKKFNNTVFLLLSVLTFMRLGLNIRFRVGWRFSNDTCMHLNLKANFLTPPNFDKKIKLSFE